MAKKKNKKKRKLNKKRVLSVLIIFLLFIIFIYKISNTNITNIYIKGNNIFTDQEIIDIAKISNYPNSIKNNFYTLEKRLEENKYILSARVYKKGFLKKVYIEIEENYPLFYNLSEDKTILYDGSKVSDKFTIPTLINKIPDTIYDEFLEKTKKMDKNILNRISEIEYNPNEVDEERFFLLMNDGNYVYITLNKYLNINKYLDIIESFENKKGILHLDSGEYFDVFND